MNKIDIGKSGGYAEPLIFKNSFMVFKEYHIDHDIKTYEFIMSTKSMSVAKDFVKAISGVMRSYDIVITDKDYNVIARYPSPEVYYRGMIE